MATITLTEPLELRTIKPSSQTLAANPTPSYHPTISVDQEVGTSSNDRTAPSSPALPSKLRIFLAVFPLCTINFLSSFTNGLVTVGLPTIAKTIFLPRSLYLWPSSIYALTSGATLLLAGSIADLVGARRVDTAGCILLGIFTLSCGFASSGLQLVVFRALQGTAMSMHLPASVALVAAFVPQGKSRNVSFGCLGLSQPLGFSAGLVISGIMIERAGWRSGFYLAGGAILTTTAIAMWFTPKSSPETAVSQSVTDSSMLVRLWKEIDWIGGTIASAGLALLAYVLATLSGDLHSIHKASTAAMFGISLALLVGFPLWMHWRQSSGKPALIPNSFWKKLPFASTCIMVAVSYGVMNSMELFSSLYFQEIQNTSTLFTSLRLLPSLLVGTIINLTVGIFVDRVSARWLVAVSSMLCAGAPLFMAVVDPKWSYWYMEFWAQVLAPMSGDVLFTVGLLIVSDEFPKEMQGLAGAVFNTVAQCGTSLIMGLCQIITLGVSRHENPSVEASVDHGSLEGSGQTLEGYQASFWTMFGMMFACSVIALGGLQKAGKVGVKKD